jgi:hypothetical protein
VIYSTARADYCPAYLFLALGYPTQTQITDFSQTVVLEMKTLFCV